jgi:ribosomal protein L17
LIGFSGDLHNRRLAGAVVRERAAVVKLFEILGPRYMYYYQPYAIS